MNVTIPLDDLVQLHRRADLYNYYKKEIEKRDQEIADINHATAKTVEEWKAAMEARTDAYEKLLKECETQAQEINNLRCELSTRPTARELQPVTKTAISNANDVLRALYRPITSKENLPNETVPGDHFHTVYKTLRDLVSRLEQEGLS